MADISINMPPLPGFRKLMLMFLPIASPEMLVALDRNVRAPLNTDSLSSLAPCRPRGLHSPHVGGYILRHALTKGFTLFPKTAPVS